MCEADNGVEPSLVKQVKLIVHKQAHFLDDIQVSVQQDQAGKVVAIQRDHAAGLIAQQQQQHHQQQSSTVASPNVRLVRLPQNSSLVRLLCSPYGDSPIQLDWLKDGHLIHTYSSSLTSTNNDNLDHNQHQTGSSSEHSSSAGRFHVSTRLNKMTPNSAGPGGMESELLLANLARHDAGLYACSARNAFGQGERKLRLIVQEQPEPPGMVDVAHISSRTIALRWLAPFDGNSPILKYVIEYKKQPMNLEPGGDGKCLKDCADSQMSEWPSRLLSHTVLATH